MAIGSGHSAVSGCVLVPFFIGSSFTPVPCWWAPTWVWLKTVAYQQAPSPSAGKSVDDCASLLWTFPFFFILGFEDLFQHRSTPAPASLLFGPCTPPATFHSVCTQNFARGWLVVEVIFYFNPPNVDPTPDVTLSFSPTAGPALFQSWKAQ